MIISFNCKNQDNSNAFAGYGSSVAPTYINEVSPKRLRGTFGASFQLGVVVSLFVAQIITLDSILGSATTWHYAFGKQAIIDEIVTEAKCFGLMQVYQLCSVCCKL